MSGVFLIIIGALAFEPGELWFIVTTGTGIAFGPAAIVGGLFRIFLFREVVFQVTEPVRQELGERLLPHVTAQIENLVEG